MRALIVSAILAAAMTATGCGSRQQAASTGQSLNATSDARYTVSQVARRAGLVSEDGGISWTGPGGCTVSVIMTTRAEVETYAGAGDAVVTNPAGDVGVKFQPDPGCREKLLAALAAVK